MSAWDKPGVDLDAIHAAAYDKYLKQRDAETKEKEAAWAVKYTVDIEAILRGPFRDRLARQNWDHDDTVSFEVIGSFDVDFYKAFTAYCLKQGYKADVSSFGPGITWFCITKIK